MNFPGVDLLENNLPKRKRIGGFWKVVFFGSTLTGLVALTILVLSILNQTMGYIVVQYKVEPSQLSEQPLEDLDQEQLIQVISNNLRAVRVRALEREQKLAERSPDELVELITDEILQTRVEATFTFMQSITERQLIEEKAAQYDNARIEWRYWINKDFLTNPQSRFPLIAGIRIAIFGSLWVILVTIGVAFPVGVGAAIYLEEYAAKNKLNRVIQTNIDNLAGVPSIVYGILGLAIFVRTLSLLTSGNLFGVDSNNGRTILSAGLTMALLVLPLFIINAQEAIRSVPNSLREAAYGVGATKWQSIWSHVLPYALPGILTGSILAISRAIGETAPLILVGASSFINKSPNSIFSLYTVLPIQIYNWTTSSQAGFKNVAAAAILVLLAALLSLNAGAILLRNKFSRR